MNHKTFFLLALIMLIALPAQSEELEMKLKDREFSSRSYESVLAPKNATQGERKRRAAVFCKELGQSLMNSIESNHTRDQMAIDPAQTDWGFLAALGAGDDIVKRTVFEAQGLRSKRSYEATTFDEHYGQLAGQIVFAEIALQIQEQASQADAIVDKRFSAFRAEKIPGFTEIDSSQDLSRQKGEQFVEVGFSKDFVRTTETEEFGAIVRVHLRDMIFNRVGGESAIQQKLQATGKVIADKYTDQVYKGGPLGLTNYHFNDRVAGTGLAPYSATDAAGNQYWNANQLTGNPLVDTPAIQAAQSLLSRQVQKDTGRALNVGIKGILTSMTTGQQAMQVINQKESRQVNGNNTRLVAGNGLLYANPSQHYDDQLGILALANGVATTRANGAAMWWGGEFKEAWQYLFNYDMRSVSLSGMNTQAFLDSGIVAQVRVSQMGSFNWRMHGPQRVVRNFDSV